MLKVLAVQKLATRSSSDGMRKNTTRKNNGGDASKYPLSVFLSIFTCLPAFESLSSRRMGSLLFTTFMIIVPLLFCFDNEGALPGACTL
ncbi:hypothetical protein D3C75_1029560 [compost metagenome]